jgi:hypothetical protein
VNKHILYVSTAVLCGQVHPAVARDTLTTLYSFPYDEGRLAPQHLAGAIAMDPAGDIFGAAEVGGANRRGVVFELSPPATSGAPWIETVISDLPSFRKDGDGPLGGVTRDKKGDLYYTARIGGSGGSGAAFRLRQTPSGWVTQELWHPAEGSSGFNPEGPLVLGSGGPILTPQGNLLVAAGANNGTVFELAPPAEPGGAWQAKLLWTFSPDAGSLPGSPLLGPHGDLFGLTTWFGIGSGGITGAAWELTH